MIVTVFDSESNGFLDVADKLWCLATVDRDTPDSTKLFTPNRVVEGLAVLHQADVLVGHNIIKHDLPLFLKLHGWKPKSHQVIVDTLVLSRMLNPKRPMPQGYTGKATHSIEAWGHRVGLAKPDHTDWTQYSDAMGERCRYDTRINLRVLEELEREAGYLPDYYKQLKSSDSLTTGD